MTTMNPINCINHAFNRVAKGYDNYAILAQEVNRRLVERLQMIKLPATRILELGCGTAYLSRLLQRHYPKAQLLGLDIAQGMLRQAQKKTSWFNRRLHFIQADAHHLPLASHSFDWVVANMLLHFSQEPELIFKELIRVVKPGGLVMFSCLGPDSLKELKQSWALLDSYEHVQNFSDMHDLGDLLLQTGWQDPVMDMEYIELTYQQFPQLLQELKQVGSVNLAAAKMPGLMSRAKLQRLMQAYEAWRTPAGLLPVTTEIIYGHAWAPLPQSTVAQPGEIKVPVTAISRIRSTSDSG